MDQVYKNGEWVPARECSLGDPCDRHFTRLLDMRIRRLTRTLHTARAWRRTA